MAWYDYIPVVGTTARLIQGDFDQAADNAIYRTIPGIGIARGVYNSYTGAQDELRKGYQNTVTGLKDEAEKQRRFQLQGLGQAQSYYQPAMEMAQAAYGSPANLRK